eukprot:TRINITY_DN1959_c0_g2_i25.p1 TRINITY_DN1959_c0_g2~~TRINITY_DN1959_c0_g2_i25.p1  ORF type:complete len:372 (-),score=60.44 TRINITY_DN1959_c0_g2_i25:943-2058(-)
MMDYFTKITKQVGNENVVIVRNDNGELNGFHNVCRHRGARICTSPEGSIKSFVCPYHAWTYDKQGTLIKATHTEGLDLSDRNLHRIHLETIDGLIFVCFSDDPPDFRVARETISSQLKFHRLWEGKIAYSKIDIIDCNWKIVYENNRECYHCAATHPEYIKANYDLYYNYISIEDSLKSIRVLDESTSKKDEITEHIEGCRDKWKRQYGFDCTVSNDFPGEGWFRATRAPMRKGWLTESLDGQPVSRIMGDFVDRDMGSFRIHILPNYWIHLSSDYASSAQLFPLGPTQTGVKSAWIVHKDAEEGKDYSLDKLVPFWEKTNNADWKICEYNMQGIMSHKYQPQPFVKKKESGIENFLLWYFNKLKKELPKE